MSTPKGPSAQTGSRNEPNEPQRSGLKVGIICGILGFLVVVAICIIVILKFKKKKKTQGDKEQCDSSLGGSEAQLLSGTRERLKVKSERPLSETKSLSCPDIYAVNKSILLKMGPTAHLYEQLEKDSAMGESTKYKSEDHVNERSMSDMSLNGTLRRLSARDGGALDNEDHIYQAPSILETFRRKSEGTKETENETSEFDFLHPKNIKDAHQKGEMLEDTSNDGTNLIDKHVSLTNPPNFELRTNIKDQYESYREKNSDLVGYQSPRFQSPKTIPRSHSFNAAPLHENTAPGADDEYNVYDVPKFNDRDRIYTNWPADVQGSQGGQLNKGGDKCKVPLKVVLMEHTRSYTVGAAVLKKTDEVDGDYDVPSSKSYYSQPSLVKMIPGDERHSIIPCDEVDRHDDDVDGDNTYDVPPTSRQVGKLWDYNDNNGNNNNDNKIRNIVNFVRESNHLTDDIIDCNNFFRRTNLPENYNNLPGEVALETKYAIPHNLASAEVSSAEDTYPCKNVSSTEESMNAMLLKKIGYDAPSITRIFDPSQPSLLKLASKNIFRSDGPDRPYDMQSSVPDFDPATVYSRRPVYKKVGANENRSKHFEGSSQIHVDEGNFIYDRPSSRDQAEVLSNTLTCNEKPTLSSHDDGGDDYVNDDAIYQNVLHLEDGRTCLRPFVPSNRSGPSP